LADIWQTPRRSGVPNGLIDPLVEVFPRALWQALVEDLRDSLQVDDPADRATLANEHSAFEAAFTAWSLSNATAPLPNLTSDPVARLEGRIWLPG